LGVPTDRIVIDPTTGGLGYGLEYSYSVMERIRMAALTQEDDKLQVPMISNIGNEVWKCKEAGQPLEEVPTLGDPERRGVLMETVAAVSYLLGGADVAILRHPESVKLTRSFIDLMMNGGLATDVPEISKNLELQEADLVSISPEPKLATAEEAVPAKAKPAKPKKKEVKAAPKPKKKEEEPKKPPKPEEKVVALKPKEKAEEEVKAKAEAEAEAKAKAEAEAKARAEEEAKAKAEAEAEAKAKAEEEVKAKAEAEAKAKAKAEAEAKAKEKADLEALKAKMAKEKKKAKAKKVPEEGMIKPTEMDLVEKLSVSLKRMHRHS
jgi:acetyl-CoA decarbonylase/synthase complex subunit delta